MKRVIAALLLFSAPVHAQVSSTAAPVANSSGSVTNQAVQVVPSRQFTNTYGGGISCQGATLNINPFISSTTGWSKPYEAYYDEPVYDNLMSVTTRNLCTISSIWLARLIRKVIPSPMAGPIIRAISFTCVQLERVRKVIFRSTAVSLPRFPYRSIDITSKLAGPPPKSK